MENFEYKPDASVVRDARSLLSSIGRCYGHDRAMAIWDYIRKGLGDDIAGDILMGMLSGIEHKLCIRTCGTDIISAIKEIRAFTNVGLVDAKRIMEQVRDYGNPQYIAVTDENQGRAASFILHMRNIGCIVD